MSNSPYLHDFTNWSKFTSAKLSEKLNSLGIEAKKGKARRQAQLNVWELGINSDAAEERLETLYGMRLAEAQALAKQYPIPTGNGRLFDLIKHIFLYEHLVLPDNKSAFNTTSNKKTYQAPTQAFAGSGNAPGLTSVQEAGGFLPRRQQGRTDRLHSSQPAFSRIQSRALGHGSTGSSPHDVLATLRHSHAQHQAAIADVLHSLEANVRMIKENMASVRKIGTDSDREFGELIAMMEEKMRLCDCGLDFE